jgi:hypothetical protein
MALRHPAHAVVYGSPWSARGLAAIDVLRWPAMEVVRSSPGVPGTREVAQVNTIHA